MADTTSATAPTKTSTATKIGAGVLSGLVLLGLGGVGGAHLFPATQTVEVPVNHTIVKEVQVPYNVTVTKEVPVVNPVNTAMQTFIKNNVGTDITPDYMVFEDAARANSEVYIQDNMIGLLNDIDAFRSGGVMSGYQQDNAQIYKISDPTVSSVDYQNKDVTLTYNVTMVAKKPYTSPEKFVFEVKVPYVNGQLVTSDISIN
jgi:hypothetical protein